MKEGQKVNYYRPELGARVDAEVVAITGVGENANKVLTLKFKEDDVEYIVEGVYHYDDGAQGEPFWLLKGARAPQGWDKEELDEGVEIPEPVPVVTKKTKKTKKR